MESEIEPIRNFAAVAKEYVEWLNSEAADPNEEAKRALLLVSNLYNKALLLPAMQCDYDLEPARIDDEQWHKIFKRCGVLPFNFYNSALKPLEMQSDEMCVGDLADDLADIYRDLAEGLELYRAGHYLDANWQWRFNFYHHWGQHASQAIALLHEYFVDASWPNFDP